MEPRDRTEYCQKQYYQQHKDKLLTYQKQYYQQHRDKLLTYQLNYNRKNTVVCPCGITTTQNYIERHQQKKIHIDKMALLNRTKDVLKSSTEW